MAATINEVSSTKSLPANDSGVRWWYYHHYQLASCWRVCMYIILKWDTAIKNCNCFCGGRRHISSSTTTTISSTTTTTIWLLRLICCYLELLMTVAVVVYTIIINLPVAEELCRYIILRWDAAICNKELQLMRGSINCHRGRWSPTMAASVISPAASVIISIGYIDFVVKWCCKRRTSYSGDCAISL